MSFIECFSVRAKKIMGYARRSVDKLKSDVMGTEHVLLGMMKEGTGVAAKVLKGNELDWSKIRQEIIIRTQKSPFYARDGKSPFSEHLREAIEHGIQEMNTLGDASLETQHLLLGMLKVPECKAAVVIQALGLDLQNVRAEVLVMSAEASASPPEQLAPSASDFPPPAAAASPAPAAARSPLKRSGSKPRPAGGRLTFTPRALKALEYADEEARSEGASRVDAQHLLRGAQRADREPL